MKTRLSAILSVTFVAGAMACGEADPEIEPVEDTALDAAPAVETPAVPPPPANTDTAQIPVAIIIGGPGPYLGQPVVGRARVAEVVTDRGFWLEQAGSRIFAVIAKTPQMEQAVNVNAGQTVAVAGVVYDSATADQIPGPLEPETRQIISDQPAFLYVAAQNVILLGPDGG